MFSGIPAEINAKIRNADGTTGRQNAGSLVCFSLANEDFTVLQQIATQGAQFSFVGDRLKVDAELDASDIQIGAVEIKNGTSDDRVVVKTDGVDFALVVTQNSQPLPTGAATQATLLAARTDIGTILATVSTAANQATEIASLAAIQVSAASIDGKLNSLGQKNMLGSVPVVLPSDQVVAISAASLPLPAGASTEATQLSVLADLDKLTFLAGRLIVDNSQVTQPVSAVALPLPAGASTSANQVTANASLTSIDGKLPAALGQHTMAASLGVVIAVDQSAIPVTIASIPLPTGAATAANQVTGNANLSSIDTKITGVALDATLQSILTDTNKFTFSATRMLTDGSGVTQPVSAASLPLPAGASTAANQATANGSLSSIDGKLTTTANGLKVDGSAVTQPVSAAALPLPTGAATSAKQPALGVAGTPSTDVITVQGAPTGTPIPVSNASLPLPAGASTSALQTSGNASLTSIDGKLGTLGQKTMAGSAPVTIASDQAGVQVRGTAAVGVAPTNPPVSVSGLDGGGLKRHLLTDTTGKLQVSNYDGSGNALTSVAADGKRAMDVAIHPGNIATYMSSTNGSVNTGTGAATVTSHAYLFHGSDVTNRYEIMKIIASYAITAGNAGNFQFRLARITAENGTPGGTSQTVNSTDPADAASSAILRTGATGAPTRQTGDLSTMIVSAATLAGGIGGTDSGATGSVVLFDAEETGKGLICRASTAEGWEVRTIVGTALTATIPVSITFVWREV